MTQPDTWLAWAPCLACTEVTAASATGVRADVRSAVLLGADGGGHGGDWRASVLGRGRLEGEEGRRRGQAGVYGL